MDKLAPLESSDSVYRVHPHPKFRLLSPILLEAVAGIGLHDSSAAMIPYPQSFEEPFLLISTGTWSISMNPFNRERLTIAELQNDCLPYLSFRGGAVKSSRLFAGYEHDLEIEKLAEFFQKGIHYYRDIQFDREIIKNLKEKNRNDFLHTDVSGSSVFAQRDFPAFANFEEAYHQLMMDIMEQQVKSTRYVMPEGSVRRIFVDGGFGKNQVFMHLLAAAFPDIEVFAAAITQASAIGAAMAIHQHWNQYPLPKNTIILKEYKPIVNC